jgi:membrane fusion protein (multidrug efflux system)
VTEVDYVRLREGMAAAISLPAMPELRRSGTVTLVSPVLDRLTRTATVEVTIDNADAVLRPGMTGRAEIELARRPGVVLAPSRSIVMLPETDETRRAAVFVVEANVASRREVTLGLRMDDAIEVTAGLDENEVVVVEGQHLLRDGVEVRTAEEDASGAAVPPPSAPTPEGATAPAGEPERETP